MAVYNANRAVMGKAKPGVVWTDMQLLCLEALLAGLKEIGLLKGEV